MIENKIGPEHLRQAEKSFRILVVDDDDMTQKVMNVLLAQLGHTVETAFSGEEAFPLLESQNFDAVFLDVHLPIMDGYEVCRQIRNTENGQRHMPVIALTASDPSGVAQQCLAAGMDDYLGKPLDQAQLEKVLASCIDGGYLPVHGEDHRSPLVENEKLVLDVRGALPYMNNDIITYKQLLAEFVHSLPAAFAELRGEYAAGSWKDVLALTHRLRGRAAILGAAVLADLTARMEQQVKEGQTGAAGQTLDEIDRCCQKLQTEADDFLEQENASQEIFDINFQPGEK